MLRFASLFCLSCFVVCASVACSDPADHAGVSRLSASAAPELSVTPNHDLYDQEQVDVRGTGFPPNMEVALGQCRLAAQSPLTDCTQSGYAQTDAAGSFATTIPAKHTIAPAFGEPFACSAPEACEIVAARKVSEIEYVPLARAPIAFLPIGPARRGTVSVDGGPVATGTVAHVRGSGWAPFATLEVGLCVRSTERCIGGLKRVHADAEGTFSLDLPAARYLVDDLGALLGYGPAITISDCAQPNVCNIRASDVRLQTNDAVLSPIALVAPPVPGGPEIIDQETALVPGATVRLTGGDWQPNRDLWLYQCTDRPPGWCNLTQEARTDQNGQLRAFVPLLESFVAKDWFPGARVDCMDGCFLLVIDSVDGATAHIPLTFDTGATIDVQSSYEPNWQPLFAQGVELSGLTPVDLQWHGAAALLWVLGASGAEPGVPFPNSGSTVYTTAYSRADYVTFSTRAAPYGYTVEELQKSGALFESWILAGKPAL